MGSSSDLLSVLGEVKARVQDRVGAVDFPMPQFILIGKQSVGKSRLIEALAGETFNFISGTLGSRRPTVLEFRHCKGKSRWYMRDRHSSEWKEMRIDRLMLEVGSAHEELGETVSAEPIYVRMESPNAIDTQIVDLPGFRDFALDPGKKSLQKDIENLVLKFMQDKNNVMLCVEQAGDAANMSVLQRCREIDPEFERTVLIRNKLDKYYGDLDENNVNKWVEGFADLPSDMQRPRRFAVTLPYWKDGMPCPKPFTQLRDENNINDVNAMRERGLASKYLPYIGFDNFAHFIERKVESMFSDALGPVLANLQGLAKKTEDKAKSLTSELDETDPQRILSTTRECGVSFATALTHVMGGILDLQPAVTLDEELRQFHRRHDNLGSTHFFKIPSDDFNGLDDYISYLRDEIRVSSFDIDLNGGAQFRRLMNEVEIYLRFAEPGAETQKRDVIQARGASMSAPTWRDIVVKLLSNEGHAPLQKRVTYVGERIRWFFESQKKCVLEFMGKLAGTPNANLYSPLYSRHAQLMKQNEVIQGLVFSTYDKACARQLKQFNDLFDSMLTSTFSNPWVFIKGKKKDANCRKRVRDDALLQNFEDTKRSIPKEIEEIAEMDEDLTRWLREIPADSHRLDTAVDKVQMLVLKTYGFIRSQVCDQVELFAESFFKLPMLRLLYEDMAQIELSGEDKEKHQIRRERLQDEIGKAEDTLFEVKACYDRLQDFQWKQASRK